MGDHLGSPGVVDFYPPKGAAKAEPVWGPIVLLILYFELLSTNVLGCFKNTNIIRFFEILKNLYCGEWVDGWVVIFYPLQFSLFSQILTSKLS